MSREWEFVGTSVPCPKCGQQVDLVVTYNPAATRGEIRLLLLNEHSDSQGQSCDRSLTVFQSARVEALS
jgi:hypothetical protein